MEKAKNLRCFTYLFLVKFFFENRKFLTKTTLVTWKKLYTTGLIFAGSSPKYADLASHDLLT